MIISSKKAIAQQQFHWVFVLIAGGVILLFFITIIGSVKTSSDNKLSLEMLRGFDAIFVGIGAAENTFNILDLPPNTQINFFCDSSGYSEFSIEGQSDGKSYANQIIFSRSEISGRQVYAFTRSIDMAFRVANALYLTDPGTLYVVVDGITEATSAYADQVYKLLPANVTKQYVSSYQNIEADGFDDVVVITFDTLTDSARSYYKKYSDTVLYIKPLGPSVLSEGSITYYASNSIGKEFDSGVGARYLGKNMLLGAIFSQNVEYYECGVSKVMDRVHVLSQLYEKRSDILQLKYSQSTCASIYVRASMALNELRTKSIDPNVMNINELGIDSESSRIGALKINIDEIESHNEEVTLSSCALLY